MIGRALLVAAVALGVAGCGSQAGSSRGSLGGIGLFAPKHIDDRVQINFAVVTRFPNADDDHAEQDRRFGWVSLRLDDRTAVATHQSQRVYKTSSFVDTDTHGLSVWRDRWRAVLPAATLAALRGRTPLTVRACDEAPADGVHCETRTIDVCVRSGRLVGEVTLAPAGVASGLGAYGRRDYGEFSCTLPRFNGGHLDGLSDPGTGFNPDPQLRPAASVRR